MTGMTSYLETLRKILQDRLTAALGVAVPVRLTKYASHGNFTTNFIMTLSRERGCVPEILAREFMPLVSDCLAGLACEEKSFPFPIKRVAYAAPGFLNFYLKAGWQQDALRQILKERELCLVETGGTCNCETGCIAFTALPSSMDFEIRYAYSRICNQLELLDSLGYHMPPVAEAHLELLTEDCEMRLMEQLAREPDLPEISKRFHVFFNISPIRGESREIAQARIALVQACKRVFESVLKESFF